MNARDALASLAEYGIPPDDVTAARISVGLERMLRHWDSEVLPFLRDGGAHLTIICEQYGRGKTHTLRVLRNHAEEQGFTTALVQCDGINRPFASMSDTYRSVAGLMKLPTDTQTMAESGLAELVFAAGRNRADDLGDLPGLSTTFRNTVRALARRALLPKSDETTRMLSALLTSNPIECTSLTDLLRREPNLPRPLSRLSRRNAATWLRSLFALPRALGRPGFVVLFDETGHDMHVAHLSRGKRQEHLANLRNLVDHMAAGLIPGCAIVYAVTADFMDVARRDLDALAQRVERPVIPGRTSLRNERAVFTTLEEQLDPGPGSSLFYAELAENLTRLAHDAGVPRSHTAAVHDELLRRATAASTSIQTDAVRGFVREVASTLSAGVAR